MEILEIAAKMSGFRCQFCKGSLMKVHYPKLYNMANLLALNVLLLPKDLTIIFFLVTIYGRGGHLGHFTLVIYVHVGFPSYRRFVQNLAFIGHAVSEKKVFECHSNKHVYCQGVGADQPLDTIFF